MSSVVPASLTLDAAEEEALKSALAEQSQLRRLPFRIEDAFRLHYQARAAGLLRKYIHQIVGLVLLIVVPAYLFRHEAVLAQWLVIGVLPTALVVFGLWGATRLRELDAYMSGLTGAGLLVCLTGMLYCAMHLDGQYLGQLSKYIAVYILIVAFTILQLPVRLLTPVALGAVLLALAAAVLTGQFPFWLEIFMYTGGPLMICTVTGYIQESSERRNFVQMLLLNQESQRLARLNAAAEENIRQQRYAADYLALISGNLSLKELFTRTLRFLTEHTGAQVGVAYHLSSRGTLRRVATWAVDADTLDDKKEIAPEATLMGPALRSGEVMQLQNVRADYLPLNLGMGTLPCAHLLVLPIVQGGKPLAVLELGRVTPFDASAQDKAEAIRTHLAYAVTAANAREIALKATTA